MSANERQIAGNHYIKYGDFQVWDAWWHWNLDAFQANIIKYVMRTKGDKAKHLEDLNKALHYLQKYREVLSGRLALQKEQMKNASWNLSQLQADIVEVVSFGDITAKLEHLDLVQPLIEQMVAQVQDSE